MTFGTDLLLQFSWFTLPTLASTNSPAAAWDYCFNHMMDKYLSCWKNSTV